MSFIVGLTASGIFDGGLNLIGKYLNGETYINNLSQTFTYSGTFSFIYDGGLNICGVNNFATFSAGVVSFIGLTTSTLGPTGPHGTASINGIYDGGVNIFGEFDNVNLRTHIYGLTTSSNF